MAASLWRDSIRQFRFFSFRRNQKREKGIPKLFHYAKILLAVQPNEVKYGAVGTAEKFWAVWKEDNETATQKIIID